MRRLASLTTAFALAFGACDGADPDPAADAGAADAATMDAGAPDTGVDAGPDPGAICDELSLDRRLFDRSGGGTAFEEVAGDFTVETLDGPWTLSESWSGCESYVFLLHTNSVVGDLLYAGLADDLFTVGPRNVHYIFGSWDPEDFIVRQMMEERRAYIEEGWEFQGLSEEDRAHWRSRVHYITEPLLGIEGSFGDFLRDANGGYFQNTFAITRQQRLDPVGSLVAFTARGQTVDISLARFFPPFYDYMHDLDAELEADDATVIPVLTDEVTTARTLDRTVTLPDAATMETFDTLEVDIQVMCRERLENCSEWDRNAYVFVCEDAECTERRELVRWITPYWRPGRRRWVMDATPLMGLVRAGGEQTFRVVFGPNWERATERTVNVSIRLSDRGLGEVAIGADLAFRGGAFNADYNTRDPFSFTPPEGTSRVELVTIVSGHGQEAANNCAEWCNHVHRFTVNDGIERVIDFPGQAGQRLGCAERTGEGVPPGQGGNWTPLRAGWCPGLPVPAVRMDITDEVDLTTGGSVVYEAGYGSGPPAGGTIDLSTYVVYYATR